MSADYRFNAAAQFEGTSALTNGSNNPFAPQESYIKNIVHYNTEEEFIPTAQAPYQYGTRITVEIDKRFAWSNEMWLQYRRTAVVQPGAGANDFTFADYEPLASMDRIDVRYNNKIVYTIYPIMLYFWIKNTGNDYEYAGSVGQTGGELGAGARLARTNAIQLYRFRIRVPWRKLFKGMPQYALPTKISYEIIFKPLLECGSTVNAGTLTHTCQITDLRLVQEGVVISDMMSANITARVNSAGLNYKIQDLERQLRVPIPAGTSQFVLNIQNLKNDTYLAFFTLRLQAAVDNVQGRNIFGGWQYPTSYFVQSGNKKLHKEIFSQEFFNLFYQECFPWYHGNNNAGMTLLGTIASTGFNLIPFCHRDLVEASEDNTLGSIAFVAYDIPQLVLNFATPTAAAMYLDLYGLIHQFLTIKQGDIKPLLSV